MNWTSCAWTWKALEKSFARNYFAFNLLAWKFFVVFLLSQPTIKFSRFLAQSANGSVERNLEKFMTWLRSSAKKLKYSSPLQGLMIFLLSAGRNKFYWVGVRCKKNSFITSLPPPPSNRMHSWKRLSASAIVHFLSLTTICLIKSVEASECEWKFHSLCSFI